MLRRRYRKEFGLTSSEMDVEPAHEVAVMAVIFDAEYERDKKENKKPNTPGQSSRPRKPRRR